MPEWTHEFKITRIYNKTQPIIGYCHWWEIKDNGARDDNSFWKNIKGTLDMKVCGVNSQWVKDLVLKRAAEEFQPHIIEKLDKIIQPWYLGTDEFIPTNEYKKKSIVFNHREGIYTGSEWFFETMDELWNERQDFEVWTSLKDMKKPYTKYIGHADRSVYMNQLGQAHFGVGCFQTYSAWSMSTTDGLSRGVPYLLPNKLCYPEMVGADYPLLYNDRKEFEEQSLKKGDGLLWQTMEDREYILLTEIQSQSPDMQKARAEVEASESKLSFEKNSRLPRLSFKASQYNDPNFTDRLYGLVVSIPIWDFKSGQVAEAEANASKAKNQLNAQSQSLEQQLETAYKLYQIATYQVKVLDQEVVELAFSARRIAEVSYRYGERGMLEYLDAQRTFRAARNDLIKARFDLATVITEIQRLRANPEWLAKIEGGK